jgi:hypothetical protein
MNFDGRRYWYWRIENAERITRSLVLDAVLITVVFPVMAALVIAAPIYGAIFLFTWLAQPRPPRPPFTCPPGHYVMEMPYDIDEYRGRQYAGTRTEYEKVCMPGEDPLEVEYERSQSQRS